MGCRFAQGYRFGRALPLDEVRILLFAEAMRNWTGPDQTGGGDTGVNRARRMRRSRH